MSGVNNREICTPTYVFAQNPLIRPQTVKSSTSSIDFGEKETDWFDFAPRTFSMNTLKETKKGTKN